MGNLCTRSDGAEETTISKFTVGKDYEEIKGEYVGEGIKRTIVWKAGITRN